MHTIGLKCGSFAEGAEGVGSGVRGLAFGYLSLARGPSCLWLQHFSCICSAAHRGDTELTLWFLIWPNREIMAFLCMNRHYYEAFHVQTSVL